MTLVIPDIICIGADLGTRKVTLAVWYNDKLLATGTMSFTHEAAKDFHLNSMVFDILNRYSMVAMGFLTPFDYKDKLKEAAHIFIEETYCGKNKRDFKALSQVLTRLSGIAADIGYTVHTITNNDWTGAIGCTPRTKAACVNYSFAGMFFHK